MSITVHALYRHPVKGLSPEALEATTLAPGQGLPGDRRYALAHGSTAFDPAAPQWLAKSHFLMLAKNPRLAALTTRWIESTNTLTIERDGRQVAYADLSSPIGRTRIADFFAAYLRDEVRGAPRVVEAEDHMFSDHKEKVVSILNLASLRDLERVAGRGLDVRRFRGNVVIDGAPAWSEFDWVEKEITLGGARLWVKKRIDRCPATSADPDTGTVDINLPLTLRKGFGHIDFGIYARVIEGGEVRLGDELRVE